MGAVKLRSLLVEMEMTVPGIPRVSGVYAVLYQGINTRTVTEDEHEEGNRRDQHAFTAFEVLDGDPFGYLRPPLERNRDTI